MDSPFGPDAGNWQESNTDPFSEQRNQFWGVSDNPFAQQQDEPFEQRWQQAETASLYPTADAQSAQSNISGARLANRFNPNRPPEMSPELQRKLLAMASGAIDAPLFNAPSSALGLISPEARQTWLDAAEQEPEANLAGRGLTGALGLRSLGGLYARYPWATASAVAGVGTATSSDEAQAGGLPLPFSAARKVASPVNTMWRQTVTNAERAKGSPLSDIEKTELYRNTFPTDSAPTHPDMSSIEPSAVKPFVGGNVKWPDELKQQAFKLARGGQTDEKIAELLSESEGREIRPAAIRSMFQRERINNPDNPDLVGTNRRVPGRPRSWTPEKIKDLVTDYESMTAQELADKHDMKVGAMYNLLSESRAKYPSLFTKDVWNPEPKDLDLIARLSKSKTPDEISNVFQVPKSEMDNVIGRLIREGKIDRRFGSDKWPVDRMALFLSDRDSGMSTLDMATKWNLSKGRIIGYLGKFRKIREAYPALFEERRDGGRISYASGGEVWDAPNTEVWDAPPSDNNWRGYGTVIGSGLAQGAITGVGKTLQGIPELYADKPEESPLAKAGRAIEQYGKEKFPLTPEEQKSISGQVATSIGTVAPIIAGGSAGALLRAPRAAGVLGTLGGAGQMGAMGAAEQAERAREKGASPETTREAARMGFGVNTALGLLPFGMIFKPIKQVSPEMTSWMTTRLKASAESGIVFAGVGEAQQWLGEEIAKEFYDPKAGYKPDAERAMVGLLSGAIIGGARRATGTDVNERPIEEPRQDRVLARPTEGLNANLEQLLAGERFRASQEERPLERPPQTDTLFPERQEQTPKTDTLFPEQKPPELPPTVTLRPQDLTVNPERFQFRAANERGVTETPKPEDVKAFDPSKVNPILAYQTNDGNVNVVNGFHRAELARLAQLSAGQSDIQIAARLLREQDGHSPEFMKTLGAYQNLAEGTGGVQAARIMRANPQGISERLGEMPSADRLASDAKALASLSPEGFGLVTKGTLPPAYAAEVARLVQDKVSQVRALEEVSKSKPENIDQVRQIVQEQSGKVEPDVAERQQVLDRAIETLRKSTASNEAERASNERLAQVLQTEGNRQGEIGKALDRAASELAAGKPISNVAPRFLAKARSIPRRELESLQSRGPINSGRPEATGVSYPSLSPLPALSVAAKAKRKGLEKVLSDLVRQQVGKHVQIKFSNKIPMQGADGYGGKFADEKTAAGMYYPAEKLIQIAMADPRYPDLWRPALHEPFHAVQDLLATPSELKILKREDGRLREIVAKELNLTPEQARGISSAEVQATAYDTWARGKLDNTPLPTGIKRLYENIKEFLRKARNAITGLGFKSANDIFESTLKGDMANRPAREPGRFVEQAETGKPVFPSVSPKTSVPSVAQPTHTLGPWAKRASNLIDKMGLGDVVRDLQIKLTPMAARDATIESRAAAKDFANQIQEAKYTRNSLDDLVTKNFTPDEQKRMWEAADNESVARQTGKTAERGLNTLTSKERSFVERLQKRADEVFEEAKRLGIYEGDEKLPSYVTRLVLMNVGGGKYERPSFRHAKSLDSIAGGNLRTTTPQMIDRKYLTAEETEAAAKGKFGPNAEILRNIRVLPYATGLLQEAIAGRTLIDRIKEAGKEAGIDTVKAGEKPTGNWFTIDHPAFYNTYDVNGVLKRTPIYVRSDFEGPLRSVLEQGNGSKIYQSLMNLKGKTMSVIMMSPMIHNQVEWGRALPAMPGKVLTGRIYFEGNKAKNDPQVMREAIRAGLVPIGHRGYMQDITSVPEMPNLEPGRSVTAKIAAAVPGLFSKSAGDAVKRTIDKMGDFWHNTLLWDRIGDLQAGLYTNLRDNLIKKGFDPLTSQRAAAHWANRYAGAIPLEAMSSSARKIANLVMFSRSFTLGNIGAMKDAYAGLPRDVQAQIARDSGFDTLNKIKGVARRKATAVMMIDIGLFYVMGSLLQSAMNVMGPGQTGATIGGAIAGGALGGLAGPLGSLAGALGGGYAGFNAVAPTGERTLDQEIEAYKKRFAQIQKHTNEHPFEVLNPFSPYKGVEMLSSTSENEPGKHDRVLVGYQKDGTAIYARLPTGKIGEEFMGWQTSPLDMMHRKLGTWARPLSQIWANDKGFGQNIYSKYPDPTTTEQVKNAGRVVWHLMSSQIPVDWIQSIADLESGHGDKNTNMLKTVGPLLGMTFSKGAPYGPAEGIRFHAAERAKFDFQVNRDAIKRKIEDGDIGSAVEMMNDLKVEPGYQRYLIQRYSGNPKLSNKKMKEFMLHSTPEEQEQMFRNLGRERPSTPESWNAP